MDAPKRGRGAPKGSRNNPAGRPRIGKAVRPTLGVTVDPDLLVWMRGYAAEHGISLGQAMDDAMGQLKAWAEAPEG